VGKALWSTTSACASVPDSSHVRPLTPDSAPKLLLSCGCCGVPIICRSYDHPHHHAVACGGAAAGGAGRGLSPLCQYDSHREDADHLQRRWNRSHRSWLACPCRVSAWAWAPWEVTLPPSVARWSVCDEAGEVVCRHCRTFACALAPGHAAAFVVEPESAA
jgi:hypothetical protein